MTLPVEEIKTGVNVGLSLWGIEQGEFNYYRRKEEFKHMTYCDSTIKIGLKMLNTHPLSNLNNTKMS